MDSESVFVGLHIDPDYGELDGQDDYTFFDDAQAEALLSGQTAFAQKQAPQPRPTVAVSMIFELDDDDTFPTAGQVVQEAQKWYNGDNADKITT